MSAYEELGRHLPELPAIPLSAWPKTFDSFGIPSCEEAGAIRNVIRNAESTLEADRELARSVLSSSSNKSHTDVTSFASA